MGCGASAPSAPAAIAPSPEEQPPSAANRANNDRGDQPPPGALPEGPGAEPANVIDYASSKDLFALLRPPKSGGLAPVKLLKGTFILTLATLLRAATTDAERMGLALKRRQELEEEQPDAFYTAEEVEALPRSEQPAAGLHVLALVSVSHCWATREHPDPLGVTILRLADAMQKKYMKHTLPKQVAVFFDWASVHQKDANGERTAAERKAFDDALGCMQIWYCHPLTTVYLMTAPHPDESVLPYEVRGWPNFERQVACICKANTINAWPLIVDAGSEENPMHNRRAPMTPSAFEELLKSKKFTNGSDEAVVAELYRHTLEAVMPAAKEIKMLENKNWGDAEMRSVVEVLPLCVEATMVDFSFSFFKLTDEGLGVLTEAVRAGRIPNKIEQIELRVPADSAVSKVAESAFRKACSSHGICPIYERRTDLL